jgi:hypothetical protein
MEKKRTIGSYFVILAGILRILSLVRFQMWAPKHNGSDLLITAGLVIGILADVILLVKEMDILKVIATAAYTIAAVRLLSDSVGSFVDAFQGIVMFGDATQVGTIISIAAVMLAAVLVSVIASFMKQSA